MNPMKQFTELGIRASDPMIQLSRELCIQAVLPGLWEDVYMIFCPNIVSNWEMAFQIRFLIEKKKDLEFLIMCIPL